MERLRTLFKVVLLGWCCGSLSHANAASRHWTVGVGLGQSQLQPGTTDTGFSVADDQDSAARLLFGYRFHPHFQTELFYADLGVAKIDPNGEINYRLAGATVLYNWPADRPQQTGWRILLKTGFASLDNESDLPFEIENDAQALAGIGAEFRLNRHLLFRSEYERFSEDAEWLSINLIWAFGRNQAKLSRTSTSAAAIAAATPDSIDRGRNGVVNTKDHCPDTLFDMQMDRMGCAVFQGHLPNVQFEPNSSILTLAAKQLLQKIADVLRHYPDIIVEIQAHTDSHGSSEYNLWLSDRRARRVAAYLIKQGVDAKQLRPTGYGETQPIYPNDTPLGRANNRRVEFKIIVDDRRR